MLFRFIINYQLNSLRNITLLGVGEKAEIREFTNTTVAGKLMAMGMLPGSMVLLVRKAPFGGAFYIKAHNHYVALRKEEAKHVWITNGK